MDKQHYRILKQINNGNIRLVSSHKDIIEQLERLAENGYITFNDRSYKLSNNDTIKIAQSGKEYVEKHCRGTFDKYIFPFIASATTYVLLELLQHLLNL